MRTAVLLLLLALPGCLTECGAIGHGVVGRGAVSDGAVGGGAVGGRPVDGCPESPCPPGYGDTLMVWFSGDKPDANGYPTDLAGMLEVGSLEPDEGTGHAVTADCLGDADCWDCDGSRTWRSPSDIDLSAITNPYTVVTLWQHDVLGTQYGWAMSNDAGYPGSLITATQYNVANNTSSSPVAHDASAGDFRVQLIQYSGSGSYSYNFDNTLLHARNDAFDSAERITWCGAYTGGPGLHFNGKMVAQWVWAGDIHPTAISDYIEERYPSLSTTDDIPNCAPLRASGECPASEPCKIATIGDSITAGAATKWPQYLEWDELTSWCAKVSNFAAGGATSTQVASQFSTSVSGADYDVVVVGGGVNDINTAGQTGAQVVTAYQAITDSVHSDGKQCLHLSMTPWGNSPAWSAGEQTHTDTANTGFASPSNASTQFVDVYTSLEDPPASDQLNASYDSGDGLHPNSAGYQTLAGVVGGVLTD